MLVPTEVHTAARFMRVGVSTLVCQARYPSSKPGLHGRDLRAVLSNRKLAEWI